MEVLSAVETSDSERQPDNEHLPRSRPCSQEDRIPNLMAPQAPGAWRIQLRGPSVLECKVRALKEKMTAGRQGTSPCLASHEWLSPKKPKCREVKVGGTGAPSEGSSWPAAVVVLPAQNLTDGKLDSSVNEEEPIGNGGPRPPRPPASGLECWNGRNPWPPEAVWTLPDHVRDLLPGPSYLQENPIHRATPCRPGDPGPCNETAHMPNLRKGKSDPPRDGLVTGGDLDSMSLTSEEDFVPRPALPGGLWRTGDLGALSTRGSALSLSDRVERNRLLLQEMLNVGGQGPTKLGIPAWTPSWDRAVAGQWGQDESWDSGISLQDSGQVRTVGPKPEPLLNPRPEEAKHLLQRARMKARTRPLRANHDIVPTIAQGSRVSQRSPATYRKLPVTCRDSLQNGSMSDSSSGESGSGQWLRQATALSHVRFEDESALEAESRYLERLQQRQRPGQDQGPLRSKPDLYDYIQGGCQHRSTPQQAQSRLVGHLDRWALPARGSEKKCQACGHYLKDQWPTPGKAPPEPRVPRDGESSERMEWVLSEPLNSQGLSCPLILPPSKQGFRVERIQDTHSGDTSAHPEEVGPALDCTDTSDTCRTDSEEAWSAQRSGACDPARGSSPRPQAARPHVGPRFWKADKESHKSPQDPCYLPGVDLAEGAKEVEEGRGYTPALPTDVLSKSPVLEAKTVSLGCQWQPGSGLGDCRAHSMDAKTPGWTVSAKASAVKLESSGPDQQAQVVESDVSLETVSPAQNLLEPPAPHQVQQPSPSPDVWVPTPPSSRKTTSPASHRKAPLDGFHRRPQQGQPIDSPLPPSRSVVPGTCEPALLQNQPRSPQVMQHRLSTDSCNKSMSQGLRESQGVALHKGKVEKEPRNQEQEPPLEACRGGGPQGFLGAAAVGAVSFTGPILSVASEESESSQEPEGGRPETESSSRGPVTSRASLEVRAGPSLPSAAPGDRSKKSGGSLTSTLGLKKFFSTLSQGTRSRLAKCRSYSVEQLQPPTSGLASHISTPKVKKVPSLQSLHLNLQSLLSGKVDRSSLYLVGEPEDDSAASRPAKALLQRALSVEDIGAPSLARTVGRVVEVFPDGTSQVQLQCSPEGTFGFCVASGDGRRDSGFYVREMADVNTAKLYSGLLGVGDEILEVNGAKVAGLGLAHIKELLSHAKSLSLRVLRQRPVPRPLAVTVTLSEALNHPVGVAGNALHKAALSTEKEERSGM
ncbi:LOW QUALITY PROTEIN: hypothetical protein J0S82_009078 [Galemys pyrenaicus]|uniref:PDZ domain-containing protein n=1 Tax=Galemys pyrenaicus TaxID=202257 RepID=A0A8J6A8P5_GALPY|nr:LOW QUALITY PROTEIN: hypothetical protein J0S82_009078 [Galemys pyrenaicus]